MQGLVESRLNDRVGVAEGKQSVNAAVLEVAKQAAGLSGRWMKLGEPEVALIA